MLCEGIFTIFRFEWKILKGQIQFSDEIIVKSLKFKTFKKPNQKLKNYQNIIETLKIE